MNRLKTFLKGTALALAVASPVFFFYSGGGQASSQPPKSHDLTTTLEDQEEVSVTVYNSNIGLVKDIRQISMLKGFTDLKFSEVAARIMPQTVHIKSLTDPSSLEVLEQNYEYDLLTPQKLLDKFVGKEIKILKDGVEIPITILSTNSGLVYRLGDRILTDHPSNLIFPGLPEDLIAKPTLVWRLENNLNRPQRVEATYLTQGINWRADYVTVLDQADQKMDLTGWVTLDNKSGVTYRNAKLKLVAGDVNRVLDEYGRREGALGLAAMEAKASAPAFKEQAFFEYHLYSLQRSTTIKDNQTKQVSLLNADQIPVTKRYLYYGADYYYRTPYGVPISNQKVAVYIEMANKKENHMGIPLPEGTVRVYKADSDGSLQFVGEDHIEHTPKDETIKIKMGEAFDLVAERKQTDWRKLSDTTYEVSFEVSIRNHKDSQVTVNVIEPIPGDWTILRNSHDYKKIEAHTVQFDVPVGKDREAKLQYKVRINF
jgi:hypothetical protein